MSEDRKVVLLRACRQLLARCERSPYVLNVLTETVQYDGADCDGYCLLQDIRDVLTCEENTHDK